MKDRKTQRAVKNVLHNELGITKDKVDSLMNDYINKKFDEKLEALVKTNHFEYKIDSIIRKQSLPIVRETLRNQLAGINIDVSLASKENITKHTTVYLLTDETSKTVVGAFFEFLNAKKECERLEKKYPNKTFMVVESELK